MTTILPILSILLQLVAAPDAAPCQPRISVSGTATTMVAADKMRWGLRVTTNGKDLKDVANRHGRETDSVLALLKRSGIPEGEIQTARMQFGENWEYKNNSRVKDGYSASTDIDFTLLDFQLYRSLWSNLAKLEGVSVEGVSYDDSKKIEHKKEMLQKALLEAKEKASAMAKTLGARIGEVLSIEEGRPMEYEGQVSIHSNALSLREAPSGEVDHGLARGKIAIQSRVQVEFRLVIDPPTP